MRRFSLLLLTLAVLLGGMIPTAAAPQSKPGRAAVIKIAMIADDGGITDQSFNQTIYEACKAYAQSYGTPFVCFQPVTSSDEERIGIINEAAGFGYNVIVTAGSRFSHAIRTMAPQHPETFFLALDLDRTLLRGYSIPPNLYCASYREEYSGYMAGYAAVRLGYRRLGFLGGRGVASIRRYGGGFIQGANDAARELALSNVTMKYLYANSFEPDEAITARMAEWYRQGTEVVFVCGGGIYVSAAEAAQAAGGRLIGVDVDQSGVIDHQYGSGMTVTSAMKDLYGAVQDSLAKIASGTLKGGRVEILGLVSADPAKNYVRLPIATTQWNDRFTVIDYQNLVAAMYHGEVKVSGNTMRSPASYATAIRLDDQGVLP